MNLIGVHSNISLCWLFQWFGRTGRSFFDLWHWYLSLLHSGLLVSTGLAIDHFVSSLKHFRLVFRVSTNGPSGDQQQSVSLKQRKSSKGQACGADAQCLRVDNVFGVHIYNRFCS